MNRSGTDSAIGGNVSDLSSSALSADGRFAAFVSSADLAGREINGVADGFVRDLHTGTTIPATVGTYGYNGGTFPFVTPSIAADGSVVLFGVSVHAVW
jgi:Tol biopolymer transport system component